MCLFQLRAKKLEDLAQETKKNRQPKDKKDAKGKQVVSDESQSDNKTEQDTPLSQETLDEMWVLCLIFYFPFKIIIIPSYNFCISLANMTIPWLFRLAASLAAEEEQDFNVNKTASTGNAQQGEEDDEDDDEEMIFVCLHFF